MYIIDVRNNKQKSDTIMEKKKFDKDKIYRYTDVSGFTFHPKNSGETVSRQLLRTPIRYMHKGKGD